MYRAYFELRDVPFDPLTSPSNPFWSRSLRHAVEQFFYARDNGAGFLLLVGEAGAGKSVAISTIVSAMSTRAPIGVVRHPTLRPRELLEEIARRFGIDAEDVHSKSSLLARLENFLSQSTAAGRKPVLIVDEAQLLSETSLEEVRLLSNLDRDGEPIVQICLAGQPEIEDRLRTEKLRQLRQRISVRCHLEPLTPKETRDYLAHRLRDAGSLRDREIFTESAAAEIYRRTAGLPREINVLAGEAMRSAFLNERQVVVVADVVAAESDSGFEGTKSPKADFRAEPYETVTPESDFEEVVPGEEPADALSIEDEPNESDDRSWEEVDLAEDASAPFDFAAPSESGSRGLRVLFRMLVALLAAAAAVALFLRFGELPEPVSPPPAPMEREDAPVPSPLGSEPPPPLTEPPPRAPDAEASLRPETPSVETSGNDAAEVEDEEGAEGRSGEERGAPEPAPGRRSRASTEDEASLAAVDSLERGSQLATAGRLDEAIAAFRRASELRPNWFAAAYNLGTALLARGAWEEAASALSRAASLEPASAEALRNLGRALHRGGRVAEAIEPLRRATALSPGEPSGHEYLGMALSDLDRHDEAVHAYRSLVAVAPGEASAFLRLGGALGESGRREEAVDAFRRALEIAPDSALGHHYLGMSLAALDRSEEAVVSLRRAAELAPEDALVHHNLGYVLQRDGRVQESIDSFRRAVDLDPGFALAYYNLALALRETGREQEAYRTMQTATRLGLDAPH